MKRLLMLFLIVAAPALDAAAEKPSAYKNLEISEIKSQIRDGYRQLAEDKAAGDLEAVREDEDIIAQDKARLREAYARYGLKYRENSWQDSDFYREEERRGISITKEAPAPM